MCFSFHFIGVFILVIFTYYYTCTYVDIVYDSVYLSTLHMYAYVTLNLAFIYIHFGSAGILTDDMFDGLSRHTKTYLFDSGDIFALSNQTKEQKSFPVHAYVCLYISFLT